MVKSAVVDGPVTYIITLLRSPAETETAPLALTAQFVSLWARAQQDFNKPVRRLSPAAKVIGANLTRRYGSGTLTKYLQFFYRHMYDESKDPLAWFAHCIPDIRKAMEG